MVLPAGVFAKIQTFRVLELDPALGLRSAVSVVVMVLFTVVVAIGDDIFQILYAGMWAFGVR